MDKLIDTIDELQSIIRPVVTKANGNNLSFPVEFTFVHVLERIHRSLTSIKLLYKTDKNVHDHSIGLIARSIITDFITTGYLIKSSTTNDELIEKLYRLYYSDLKKFEKFINLFVRGGTVSVEQYKAYEQQKLEKTIQGQIWRVAEEERLKEFPQTAQLVEHMFQYSPADIWASEIVHSYDPWTLFSKYEHIGWYSYEFTRHKTREKIDVGLEDILRYCSIMTADCLNVLEEKEPMEKAIKLRNALILTKTNKAGKR